MRRVILFLLIALLAPAFQSLLRDEARDQDRVRKSNLNVGLQGNGGQADAREKRSNQREIEFLKSRVKHLLEKNNALRSRVDQLKKKDDALRSRIDELKNKDEVLRSTVNDLKMQIEQGGQRQGGLLSPAMLERQIARLAVIVNASHILDPNTMQMTAIEDCEEVRSRSLPAGTYFLRPYGLPVFCTAAGEMMVLRKDSGASKKGDVNFNTSWTQYRSDFGEVEAGDEFVDYDFLNNFTRDNDVCMRRLTAGHLVVKKKMDIPGTRGEVVFSRISPPKEECYGEWKDLMKLFTVPETSTYSVTMAGSSGGHSFKHNNPRPGGRGARLRAEFLWRKGEVIGAYAACFFEGYKEKPSGVGGDASWLIHESRKILLAGAGAGGGGGRGESEDNDGSSNFPILPGLYGRSSRNAGDAWYDARSRAVDFSTCKICFSDFPASILDTARLQKIWLRKKQFSVRAYDWEYVHTRDYSRNYGLRILRVPNKYGIILEGALTMAESGRRNRDTGGGGGGFEGGLMDGRLCCYEGVCLRSAGGGGSSFCNATESRECRVEEGGSGRFDGFVIIERRLCA